MLNKFLLAAVFALALHSVPAMTAGLDAQFYEPTEPFVPSSREQCQNYADDWNDRLRVLLDRHHHCIEESKNGRSLVEWNALYKIYEVSGCRSASTVPECIPAYREHCEAQKRRDKVVRSCFDDAKNAQPDDGDALVEKFRNEKKRIESLTNKSNLKKTTAQKLGAKVQGDALKRISTIQERALRDLAQSKARINSNTATTHTKTTTFTPLPNKSVARRELLLNNERIKEEQRLEDIAAEEARQAEARQQEREARQLALDEEFERDERRQRRENDIFERLERSEREWEAYKRSKSKRSSSGSSSSSTRQKQSESRCGNCVNNRNTVTGDYCICGNR